MPVFFFPLPNGFGEQILSGIEHEKSGSVLLVDSTDEILPIKHSDIKQVILGERLNLFLALQLAYSHFGPNEILFPPIHSTAGFGMMFTGMDRDHPEKNILGKEALLQLPKSPLYERLLKVIGIDSAYALTPQEAEAVAKSHAKLKGRLIRLGIILGSGVVISVALRYTVYRKTFAERRLRDLEEARRTGLPTSKFGILRHIKEVFDVDAAVLTTMSQLSSVAAANIVEYTLDRFTPRMAAGENTMVRKFLDWSMYFQRNTFENVPVNARTLAYGLAFGAMDSAQVALQLYFVVPQVGHKIGQLIPSLESRAHEAFAPGSPITATLNVSEVIRNMGGYAISAPSDFSSSQKQIVYQKVQREVEQQLASEGFDLSSPETQRTARERIETLVRTANKKAGLPGEEDFLFDFVTLTQNMRSLLGYEVSQAAPAKQGEADSKKPAEHYMGFKRPGAVRSSISLAIRQCKKDLEQNPSNVAAKNALPILEKARTRSSFVQSLLAEPIKNIFGRGRDIGKSIKQRIEAVRAFRKSLILLTFEGGERAFVEASRLPTFWVEEFGQEGAQSAATYYRRAVQSVVTGDRLFLEEVPADKRAQVLKEAISRARDNLMEAYPQEVEAFEGRVQLSQEQQRELQALKDAAEEKTISRHSVEFSLLVENHIISAIRDLKNAAKTYKPTTGRLSWFANGQKAKIVERANEKFKAEVRREFNPADFSDDVQIWRTKFKEEYFKELGLYPDYGSEPQLEKSIRTQVEKISKSILSDPSLVHYLTELKAKGEHQKAAAEVATLLARAEVDAYINTVVHGDKVNAISPAQPGFFQKLRQSSLLGGEKFKMSKAINAAIRMIRLMESPFAEAEFRLGFGAKIYRSVPFAYDLWEFGIVRTARRIPTAITAGFLFNRWVWGSDMAYSQWLVLVCLVVPTISAPYRWTLRVFNYQGLKPMGSMWMAALHGTLHSWASFWGSVPQQLFAGDVDRGVSRIKETVGNGVDSAMRTCRSALGHLGRNDK